MPTSSINGIDLSFVDQGRGQVLLFVHGFPLDHTMWDNQIKILSVSNRVIAPDLRGFGHSGVTDTIVTMAQFADDLAALLDYLSIREPIVLCGLSMGGYIAFEFWRRYTDRLCGLILCDTRAANDTPEASIARLALAERVLNEGTHFVAELMIPKIFAPITLHKQRDLIETIRQTIYRTDRRGIASASHGMAQRTDFTAELPRIACPTLVMVGENDLVSTVDEMQGIAQAIPHAQISIVENAAHMSPLEQPHSANAAIESFLRLIK
jgi:3-oxoadipate enol-lactonase